MISAGRIGKLVPLKRDSDMPILFPSEIIALGNGAMGFKEKHFRA
jgi:hypothetical protein